MFYISSENRERAQWLDDVAARASALATSVDPSTLTYSNGFHQSWGDNWWGHYIETLDKIEMPSVRLGKFVLSRSQRKREITPVIPVSTTSTTYTAGKSAKYMNTLQLRDSTARLRANDLAPLPRARVPKSIFTPLVKDSNSLSLEDDGADGIALTPLKEVVCLEQGGTHRTQTFRLSPVILLRTCNNTDYPSLVLLHEGRHYEQHSYDTRPSLMTIEHEIDAYMFMSDLINAAVRSQDPRYRNAAWLVNSQSYLRGNAMKNIVGLEDVRDLDRSTLEAVVGL